jgi:hypothetical protein
MIYDFLWYTDDMRQKLCLLFGDMKELNYDIK